MEERIEGEKLGDEVADLFAPVHTIFPELKTSAVVRGSLIRIMTAANLCHTVTNIIIEWPPHPRENAWSLGMG